MTMHTAMEESFAQQQRDRRDHAVCRAIAHKIGETYRDAPIPLDSYDLRCLLNEVTLKAAYEAIQKERALHKDEVTLLDQWMNTRLLTGALTPSPPLIRESGK